MKFKWIITKNDIELLNSFVNKHRANNFVKNRIRRNLSDNPPEFTKNGEKITDWFI